MILDGTNPTADARLMADVQSARAEPTDAELAKAAKHNGIMTAATWLLKNGHNRAAFALMDAQDQGRFNG